jgi:succinate-acetate transporter protein
MELILIVLSPSFLMLSPTFFAVLIIADIAVGFIAAVYLKMVGLIGLLVAGWALLALGILGLYLILAIVFNETYGSVVFPVGGPVIKRRVS